MIVSPDFIDLPRIICFFDNMPVTIPERSNENPFPENKSGIIAVSPPTIGTLAFFAPFANPCTIFRKIAVSFLLAAI